MNKLASHLSEIQKTLNAPKNQRNTFGGYNYRSCEDILSAVKPILGEGVYVRLTDDVRAIGNRVYVVSVASISDGESIIESTGWARESETRKGMDDSQITGSASSYARKYALNGLFAIDDEKDADSDHSSPAQGQNHQKKQANKHALSDIDIEWINACKADPSIINQINDPDYKKFIQSHLK